MERSPPPEPHSVGRIRRIVACLRQSLTRSEFRSRDDPLSFRRCAFEIEMVGIVPAHGNVSGEGETEYWSVLEIGKSLG